MSRRPLLSEFQSQPHRGARRVPLDGQPGVRPSLHAKAHRFAQRVDGVASPRRRADAASASSGATGARTISTQSRASRPLGFGVQLGLLAGSVLNRLSVDAREEPRRASSRLPSTLQRADHPPRGETAMPGAEAHGEERHRRTSTREWPNCLHRFRAAGRRSQEAGPAVIGAARRMSWSESSPRP